MRFVVVPTLGTDETSSTVSGAGAPFDAFDNQEWFPPAVAANAGTILVTGPDGWLGYEL